MTTAENKELIQRIFAELSKGNGKPFVEAMADDFCWIITGSTRWSGAYRGKRAVLEELVRPLFAQFADPYRNTAERIIAEDDYIVVQCRGNVTTTSGKAYNNTYCYVIRMSGGKMRELTEYLDTALVAEVLVDRVA